MTWQGIISLVSYIGVALLLTPVLGAYLTKVYNREKTVFDVVLVPLENLIYRLCGVASDDEYYWRDYAIAVITFGIINIIILFLILSFQDLLPFNPQNFPGLRFDLAFNSAIAFSTNTDWQPYNVEEHISYFSKIVGFGVQNFISAAVALSVAVAVIRGFARSSTKTIGNFWVDLTRSTLWVLLPMCIIIAPVLIWQGVPENYSEYLAVKTLEGHEQQIAMGPVASRMPIIVFGSNGGGVFGANAAHPFANPTGITNLIYSILMLLLGFSLTNVFGRMVDDTKQGWAVLATAVMILIMGVIATYHYESKQNPLFSDARLNQQVSNDNVGGNMEGKEVRIGLANSSFWAVVTTGTDNGSVNSMHDSYTPPSTIALMFNMMTGSIVGGSGASLYMMITYSVITVFILCLMVGISPEYLGKRIEKLDVKIAMYIIVILPLLILGFSSLALLNNEVVSSVTNHGPHGLSQLLYNYTSVSANNGSAFSGFDANTTYYNITMGIACLFGKYLVVFLVLSLAGSFAEKKRVIKTSNSFETNTVTFSVLLVVVILMMGMLTFMPSIALGPIAEQVMLGYSKTF